MILCRPIKRPDTFYYCSSSHYCFISLYVETTSPLISIEITQAVRHIIKIQRPLVCTRANSCKWRMACIINVGDGAVNAIENERDGHAVICLGHVEVVRCGVRVSIRQDKAGRRGGLRIRTARAKSHCRQQRFHSSGGSVHTQVFLRLVFFLSLSPDVQVISKGHWRERGFIHGKFTQRFFDMQIFYKIILVLNEKFFRHVFNRLRSLIERRSYINSEKRQNNVTMR